MKYQADRVPLLVFAGQEYGSGSSRDWAAKGTKLLGVRAVIAQSFERIHRSNLVGMGVLPCVFRDGENARSLGITGNELFDISGIEGRVSPRQELTLTITPPDGEPRSVPIRSRIDTPIEVEYYQHGGILPYVLRELVA
jgi:aconitate hydratase